MIICPNCSRENEDHYKFCLGCGTELSASSRVPGRPEATELPKPAPARPVPTAIPQATPAPRAKPVQPPAPSVVTTAAVPSVVVQARLSQATAKAPPPPVDEPEALDDAPEPEALDALGVEPPPSTAPDTPLSMDADIFDPPPVMDDSELTDPAGYEDGTQSRLCIQCGATVPEGFRFCGVCGARYDPGAPAPAPAVESSPVSSDVPPMARLVVIRPDGSQGDVFPLDSAHTTVGRSHPSLIFSQDPFLSPQHASFTLGSKGLTVSDEGSLNGVFVRIKTEIQLFNGDQFRIGQELFIFEEMSRVLPISPGAGDGTTVLGSPMRGAWGRISALVAVYTTAGVWTLHQPEEILGRERGDIIFPDDGFISGTHCRLAWRDGTAWMLDLGSSNGTYLRVRESHQLSSGDLILLGQQLFKVELGA